MAWEARTRLPRKWSGGADSDAPSITRAVPVYASAGWAGRGGTAPGTGSRAAAAGRHGMDRRPTTGQRGQDRGTLPNVSPDDPLLTPPEDGWLRRPQPGEDPERVAVEGVLDFLDATAMSWPARSSDGRLAPPPVEHVLDHLARSHDLVEELEALSRPAGPYTVECVGELPRCELCEAGFARYYGHLEVQVRRVGARLCPDCYVDRCSGRLGSATGDLYLMRYDEVPAAVRQVCDIITRRQGRPSLWP